MSLEYSDDNELIYQAKAVAKDIVNAKYEITKKVGSFLFLAHSDEEFYQRATTIDEILESTSSRKLASVSDSKAKLVKALYQEWELKHASCDECAQVKFKLPERVAFPITPKERDAKTRLWDKWFVLNPNKETGKVERRDLDKVTSKGRPASSEQIKNLKASALDNAIGGSLGRLDDPEIAKLVTPSSRLWIVPEGIYGRDKKRTDASRKPGRNEEGEPIIDPTKFHAMVGQPLGISALGNEGIFHTHHKCTGNTFTGFDRGDNSFSPCQHRHRDGDGCGLTSDTPGVTEGSIQPGCGQQHILTKVMTPIFASRQGRVDAYPFLADDEEKDISDLPAQNRQVIMNRRQKSGITADDMAHPSMEQVGPVPPHRAFLMHPDQSADFATEEDRYHTETGGEGSHPTHLDQFKIGDKTHRVGDIVSLTNSWGDNEPQTEHNLGLVLGVSSHRNTKHFSLNRRKGISPNTEDSIFTKNGTPGEYSVIIQRLHSPKPGKQRYPATAVEPDTGKIVSGVNEETQYYPSSAINTIKPYQKGKSNTPSKLYSTMKKIQSTFKARPVPERAEKPKTVNPGRGALDLSTFSLDDIDFD
jgi:hypothetical protein